MLLTPGRRTSRWPKACEWPPGCFGTRCPRAVDAAMAKDPARRPPSAESMLALLAGEVDSLAERLPFGATAVLPADTTIKGRRVAAHGGSWWTRRNRRRLSIIALAAAAVLVALGLVVAVGDSADLSPTRTTSVPAADPAAARTVR